MYSVYFALDDEEHKTPMWVRVNLPDMNCELAKDCARGLLAAHVNHNEGKIRFGYGMARIGAVIEVI